MVSASEFQPEGRWFEPGLYCRVVFFDKKLCSTLSLFIQVNKWVPAAQCWRVTLRWTSVPFRRVVILSVETGLSSGSCAPLSS